MGSSTTSNEVVIEFMPGRRVTVPAANLQQPPTYCICKLVKQPNGMFATVPLEFGPQVRMTRSEHHRLGLPCSYTTLRKLVLAEFVEGHVITPDVITVDLRSLIEHFEATRVSSDRERFWTTERIERFRQANGGLRDVGD